MKEAPFIADRAMIDKVMMLRARYGESAALEAAIRAEESRGRGNVKHFCRWREVARLVELLATEEATGTLH